MKLPFFVNLYISCLCDPLSVWNKLPFNPFCKVVWFSFYSFDSVFSVPCIKVFCSWNSGFLWYLAKSSCPFMLSVTVFVLFSLQIFSDI